jgi:hypothetical protein
MKHWLMALVAGLLFVSMVPQASANDREATGYIAVETPLGSVDRPQDDSPMVLGRLTLNNFAGPFGLFVGGQVAFRKGLPWSTENKAIVGIEAPLAGGYTVYTFAERRFNLNDNRFVAGIRYSFGSSY